MSDEQVKETKMEEYQTRNIYKFKRLIQIHLQFQVCVFICIWP